jgi:hypothetical protein
MQLPIGLFLAAVLTGAPRLDYAAQPEEPNCLSADVPPQYAPLDSPPIARATRVKSGATAPAGAGCFAKSESAATWITVAAVIRTSSSSSTLIGRFGAISQLVAVEYWSTTDQKWRPMVSSAAAIVATDSRKPRADYSAAELTTGEDRYYIVTDTRLGHSVAYRLRKRLSQPGRLVVETANVDAIRKWGLTLYAPEDVDTLYFLSERSPGVWAYYSITRVLPNSVLAEGHDESFINRAVALYRHYMGLPTDAEPPAAR